MLYWGKKMAKTKIQISKKQAKQLVEQLKNDQNFMPYEGKLGFYYSFLGKKGEVDILIYEFDKKYYLEINSLS